MKDKNLWNGFMLFCVGVLLAFGFITALKFTSPVVNLLAFLGCLIGMHAGIIGFIFSKKLFKRAGVDAKAFYGEVYFYLAFYIPLLFYKFILFKPLGLLTNEQFTIIILTVTAVLLIICVRTIIRLYKSICNGLLPPYVAKERKK